VKPQRSALSNLTLKTVHDWLVNHSRVLAGNITFGDTMTNNEPGRNIQNWKAFGVTPAAANTDFTIQHMLGRIPITIAAQDTNNGGLLYRSPVTPWTKTTVTLRCTTASAVYNVILI
jgi:hypothetical protein